ncbi:MAG: membrane protein insertase YidC, partial [Betaproteobacteria bacterium]|nr:membrane protein insertase YidC [Betaproteobacteria bacterium]
MNDIRRTILWVVFGFSMVLLWDQWQVYNGHKATFFPGPSQSTSAAPSVGASGAAGVQSSVPAPAAVAAPVAGAQAVPGTAVAAAATASAPAVPRERVVVTTDVLKLTLDMEGGSLLKTEFLQHVDMADKKRNFVLLDDSKDRVYMAQSGLIAGAAGGGMPTHKTMMTLAPGELQLKDGSKELVLRFESPELGGVKLGKTYTLTRGAYAVKVKHEVLNVGTVPVSPQLYLQLVRDGNKPSGESSFYSTFTGPAVYTEAKKYQKVEFSDIEKGKVE